MADFPTSSYTARTKSNRSGVTYDATKEKVLFVEDINNLDAEIKAVEDYLRGTAHFLSVPTSPSGLVSGDVWCDTTGGLNILKLVL